VFWLEAAGVQLAVATQHTKGLHRQDPASCNAREHGLPVRAKGRHNRGRDDAMSEDEVVWPTGMSDQDPAARDRPLVFNPQGFLVAILNDADQAEQAKTTLAEAGFAERDLRVYTSQQILDSWERFQAERSLPQRVAGAITDDPDTIEQYFGYARQGRSALWVHVPDDADAKRAVRALADHQVLHFRHYGHGSQQDLHIR
jgi:hypothetical protein